MRKKLNNILLVDDSKADNFLNSRVIRKAEVTEKITVTYGAQKALDYLTTKVEEAYPTPAILFLDINMPGMTGWDFLDEYAKLDEDQKAKIIVCMLTTSYAENDRAKATKYNTLDSFSSKPLTEEKLMDIIGEHFPEHL